jgi:FkbM family methyltransferase
MPTAARACRARAADTALVLMLWQTAAVSGGCGGMPTAARACRARAADPAFLQCAPVRTPTPTARPQTACGVVRRGQAREGGRGGPGRVRDLRGGGAQGPHVRRETHLEKNHRLGLVADSIVQGLGHEFTWRRQSNDANAIVEVFGSQALGKTPAYLCSCVDFSPRGHVVLDLGGHIGAFGVFAILQGASKVEAYEPHGGNADLYRANTRHLPITLHQVALTSDTGGGGGGGLGTADLVLGREYQGVANTWRHSLAPYALYKGNVDSVQVSTMPFSSALTDEVTFVEMDCEGAEALLRCC